MPLFDKALDEVPDPDPNFGIQSCRGLVEEHQLGVADQPEGEVETPPLPTRQLMDPAVPLLGQIESLQQDVGLEWLRVVGGEGADHLANGQLVVLGADLEHGTDS